MTQQGQFSIVTFARFVYYSNTYDKIILPPTCIFGNHIRSLGDERRRRISGSSHGVANGRIKVRDDINTGERPIFVGKTASIELYPPDSHGFELHFGLPLVNVSERLGQDAAKESVRTHFDETTLRRPKLLGPQPFRTIGRNDEGAAWRQDVNRGHHTLDRLVVGLVERKPGGRRDDGGETLRHRHLNPVLDKADRRQMTSNDFS